MNKKHWDRPKKDKLWSKVNVWNIMMTI